MAQRAPSLVVGLAAIVSMMWTSAVHAQARGAPGPDEFKRSLEGQLQKLRPTGFTVRTVLFERVRAGTPNGGYYPFMVTATIHDYGPGYPPNKYYGQTCVGRMEDWKFDMRRDDFGEWIVQGRMTVTDRLCKNNTAANVSVMPVADLPGAPAAPSPKSDGTTAAEVPLAPSSSLYLGEYACYGTRGTLMAGMGFRLQANGRYGDLDDGRAGTYTYDASAASITFRGGFLAGQVGRNVRNTGFRLSATVNCEPWR